MHSNPSKQQGMALLVVLSVVAVIVMIVAQLNERLDFTVRRTASIENSVYALNEALSYEGKVQFMLAHRSEIIGAMGPMAAEFASNEMDTGYVLEMFNQYLEQGVALEEDSLIQSLSGKARDLHSCFNLNSLGRDGDTQASGGLEQTGSVIVLNNEFPPKGTIGYAQYKRLLELVLGPQDDPALVENLALALADWIDTDTQGQFEDSAYEKYRPGNGYLASITELKAVSGYLQMVEIVDESAVAQGNFDPKRMTVYDAIKDYVCVRLDNDIKLNPHAIGGGRPELIASLFNASAKLTLEDVDGWLSEMDGTPPGLGDSLSSSTDKVKPMTDFKTFLEDDLFKDKKDQLIHDDLKKDESKNEKLSDTANNVITAKSEDYELTSRVLLETGGVVLTSMFKKTEGAGDTPTRVRVVRRSLGSSL